ncbi:ATP F0F1 synthase subunit B' [Rickettsia endosymbiont of Polydrusus tereticollis]|uniref:F0F1 ATP synthase subunit B family protein n=1 Tax=Rickettsia endosymbiont of Polydrusus tereticollis TaxID=3066251 RepID=UPI003132FD61
MPQFDLTNYYSQIFWLIVTFSLLYIVVYKFIVPVAEQILNNRQVNIQDNVEQADKLTLEAEELTKYYHEELTKISDDIAHLKKEAINSLEATFLVKKTNMEKELKQQIKQNLEDINIANKAFWLNGNNAVASLAANVIKKITGKQADINLLKKITGK